MSQNDQKNADNGAESAAGRRERIAPEMQNRTISAPQELFDAADKRARERRMANFSEYFRDLIRRDLDVAAAESQK